MARTQQQLRQPGDPVRVNLGGDVADHVATEATRLGISYSAYVQLRLQGRLTPEPEQTKVVRFEPARTESAYAKPSRTLAVLPEPPQTTDGDPEIQSIADFPPT